MNQPQASSELIWQRIQAVCMSRGIRTSQLASEAEISRATLHNLASGTTASPRVETLQRIADVLQIELSELTQLNSMVDTPGLPIGSEGDANSTFDRATNTQIKEVFRNSPELFENWSIQEWDELYSSFGVGGELSEEGVKHIAGQINRKREVIRKLEVVLETHLGKHAEEMIESLYRTIRVTSDNLETDAQLQKLIDNLRG